MEEQNEQVTIKQVAIKWGLMLGIISIVLFLALYFGGFSGESWTSWLGAVFTITLIYLAHKEYKDQGDGYMSYSQGLGLGTLTAGISGTVSSIFSYVYTKFINLDYLTEMMDMARVKMEDQGQSDDQIEVAMGFVEKMMTPEITLGIGFIGAIFFGFIIALIVSAFTKNNNPSLEI